MPEIHHQYELARGSTHWVAWFTNDQLVPLLRDDGWVIQRAYWDTGLVLNSRGQLVESSPEL